MEIKYFGNQTVLIKGKKESVLINPEKSFLEKNRPRIILFNVRKVEEMNPEGDKVVIMGPGEYEIGGIEINGINSGEESTIYTLVVDGLTLGVLGNLKEQLTDKKIEKISSMDILVVDINGLGAKAIMALAKKWGANYVIPVGHDDETQLKKFIDVADLEGAEPVEFFKADKENLPDGTEAVILKKTN